MLQHTFRVELSMHVRVVLLQPFLALPDSAAKFAVLVGDFGQRRLKAKRGAWSMSCLWLEMWYDYLGRECADYVPTQSALLNPSRMWSQARIFPHLHSRQRGEPGVR